VALEVKQSLAGEWRQLVVLEEAQLRLPREGLFDPIEVGVDIDRHALIPERAVRVAVLLLGHVLSRLACRGSKCDLASR